MTLPIRSRSSVFAVLACLAWLATAVAAARAGTSADVSAVVGKSALVAGTTVRVAVVIDVHDGLHAQSHAPGNKDYIATEIRPAALPAGLTAGAVQYPPGQDVDFPSLGAKLNVYVAKVVAVVPVTIPADAKPGAVTISGTVKLQACNDRACFPPERVPFTVDTTVVPAGTAVTDVQPELFPAEPTTRPTAAPPAAAPPAAAPPAKGSTGGNGDGNWFADHLKSGGLPFALAAAFVIGICFNAVPCVLPVIPLKVLGFYEASKSDRGRCLLLGGAFGGGIVATFLALGVLIAGLHVVDWGHLFQNAWFIAALTALLLAVAAGTFGLFDLALPTGVYGFNPRHDNLTGNFLFGILTAVLSTPCTFGLLTVLLVWTVTLTWPAAVAVFVVIGLGMAAPYVVLSGFPELARRFPRTGPWSDVVKKEMGLLMLATAVFFAQPLLARVMPAEAGWWVLFATVVASAAFLLGRAVQLSAFRLPTLVAAAASTAMVAVALLLVLRLTRWPYQWQPYTPAALAQATAAGHPVVIDFTADWCTTCHYLEAGALHDPKLVSAVRDHRAVMLRADVTNGTGPGQALLDQLNPAKSIPVTAVYPPHAQGRPGAVLTDIYSADTLVGTLNRVAGG